MGIIQKIKEYRHWRSEQRKAALRTIVRNEVIGVLYDNDYKHDDELIKFGEHVMMYTLLNSPEIIHKVKVKYNNK